MAPLAILAFSSMGRGRLGRYEPSISLYSHLCPIKPMAHSQLYTGCSAIFMAKQWASLRQYQASKFSGHLYVGNVIFGLAVVVVVVRIVVVLIIGGA